MAKMDGPCDDARYLKLIKTSREDLSLKQKSYISSIEKDCAEYSSNGETRNLGTCGLDVVGAVWNDQSVGRRARRF